MTAAAIGRWGDVVDDADLTRQWYFGNFSRRGSLRARVGWTVAPLTYTALGSVESARGGGLGLSTMHRSDRAATRGCRYPRDRRGLPGAKSGGATCSVLDRVLWPQPQGIVGRGPHRW